MAVTHRGYGAPSRTRGHALGAEFLAAPRTQDHVGRATRHFQRIGDDAVLAERLACELGKAVVATGDAHELRDPADAGNLWLVPFLEIDPRTARESRGALPHQLDARLELLDECRGFRRATDHAAER